MHNIFKLGRYLVIIGISFLLTAQILACKELFGSSVDSGGIDGQIYSNKYFGFSLMVPDNWYALDKNGMVAVSEEGSRMVAGDDKNLKAAVKAGEKNTVNLIMAYEHPPGKPVDFNPSIGCVAEKVSHLPGLKSGRDYLLNMKRFMRMSQVRMSFAEEIEAVDIDGVEFDLLYAEASVGPMTVSQEYYTSIRKGYALSFVISYIDDEQHSNLQETLDSVRFD